MSIPVTGLVTLYIKPECMEEYLEALREVLPQARREPGCVFLYAHEVPGEPGTMVLLEQWRDLEEYRNEVLQRDYFKRYMEISEALYAKPRVVTILNPIALAEAAAS
jgi:quinol monooxygenase YgiN